MTLQLKRIIKPSKDSGKNKFKALKLSGKLMGEELAKNLHEALIEAKGLSWDHWHNSEPLIMAYTDEEENIAYLFPISEELENKIILYDFIDLNLVHTQRCLDYIAELHKRYSPAGLQIIAIHSPLFSFEKEREYITDLIRRSNIKYPVVCDNDYAIWNVFENVAWPRRVLVNTKNNTILDIFEEGNYVLLEKTIQEQLRLMSPGLACPPLLAEPYSLDTQGGEVFFGINQMAKFANAPEETEVGEEQILSSMDNVALNTPWLVGKWQFQAESVHPTLAMNKEIIGEQTLNINIKCKSVWLVSAPKAKVIGNIPKPTKTIVTLNGHPVPDNFMGKDLQHSESRKTQLNLRGPRMRQVLSNLEGGPHELSFHIDPEGYETVEFYALYFEG